MNDGDRRSRNSRDRAEREGEKFESKERFLKPWAKEGGKGVEEKTLGFYGEVVVVVFLMAGWVRCIQSHGM